MLRRREKTAFADCIMDIETIGEDLIKNKVSIQIGDFKFTFSRSADECGLGCYFIGIAMWLGFVDCSIFSAQTRGVLAWIE